MLSFGRDFANRLYLVGLVVECGVHQRPKKTQFHGARILSLHERDLAL